MTMMLERLFFLGRILSPLYGLIMRMRAVFYRHGILRHKKLAVPVISVGNLTMGGTGKTPMVLHLSRLLADQGYKPAVISRGYGGKAPQYVNVVSDGRQVFLSAEMAGDEPRFLAENLPDVPVLIGRRRAEVGRIAVESIGADCIVLDDGFQHLALDRDLDLVLFNGQSLIGEGRVFPGGYLREPLSALERAQAFVITGVGEGEDPRVTVFADFLGKRFPNRSIFFAPYRVIDLYQYSPGDSLSPMVKNPGLLFAFCGLANPDSFKKTINNFDLDLVGFKAFRDHHIYTSADLELLCKEAREAGACGLLTTEKDKVKLIPEYFSDMPLFIVKAELDVPKELDQFVLDKVAVAKLVGKSIF